MVPLDGHIFVAVSCYDGKAALITACRRRYAATRDEVEAVGAIQPKTMADVAQCCREVFLLPPYAPPEEYVPV